MPGIETQSGSLVSPQEGDTLPEPTPWESLESKTNPEPDEYGSLKHLKLSPEAQQYYDDEIRNLNEMANSNFGQLRQRYTPERIDALREDIRRKAARMTMEALERAEEPEPAPEPEPVPEPTAEPEPAPEPEPVPEPTAEPEPAVEIKPVVGPIPEPDPQELFSDLDEPDGIEPEPVEESTATPEPEPTAEPDGIEPESTSEAEASSIVETIRQDLEVLKKDINDYIDNKLSKIIAGIKEGPTSKSNAKKAPLPPKYTYSGDGRFYLRHPSNNSRPTSEEPEPTAEPEPVTDSESSPENQEPQNDLSNLSDEELHYMVTAIDKLPVIRQELPWIDDEGLEYFIKYSFDSDDKDKFQAWYEKLAEESKQDIFQFLDDHEDYSPAVRKYYHMN